MFNTWKVTNAKYVAIGQILSTILTFVTDINQSTVDKGKMNKNEQE